MSEVTVDNWFEELKAEIARTSLTAVAAAIGYARPSLSLAVNGKYVGSTDNIRDAYIAYRRQVDCPFTGEKVTPAYCREVYSEEPPLHNPNRMRHWRTCQGCVHCPKGGEK